MKELRATKGGPLRVLFSFDPRRQAILLLGGDTLLRLAERGLYRALWSLDIIDEIRRDLIEDDISATSVDHLLIEMAAAF